MSHSCFRLHGKGVVVNSVLQRIVGNRRNTLFWKQTWMDDSTLDKRFPRVFQLDLEKDYNIKNCMKDGGMCWNWRRPLRGGFEMLQYTRLLDCLSEVTLNEKNNSWVSTIDDDGVFTVSATRRWIDDIILPNSCMVTRLNAFVPRKVNILI